MSTPTLLVRVKMWFSRLLAILALPEPKPTAPVPMAGIRVTFQTVINCHPDEYHLFEMDYDEFQAIWPSMMLKDVPGIPNVVGPVAEFDNRITNLNFDGKRKRLLAQIHGHRYPTETLEEVKKDMPEWTYIRHIPREMINDQDKLRLGR